MTGQELLALLERRGAMLSGHFLLSSGLHSDRFIQKFRIFEHPPTAEAVCAGLAKAALEYDAEVVMSAAVGGILPGYIVAKHLGVRDIFTEKIDGKAMLRRGFALSPNERVLIVEDVLTTGKSSLETALVAEAHGARVQAIAAVVKRGKADLPYPTVALLNFPLADYTPENCPQCRQGVALADPGSRRLSGLKG